MPNKNEINNFSLIIEKLSIDKGISILDAIILQCEKTGLEVELAAKLLNKTLKTRLKLEAEKLNFLPKSSSKKLPL